MFLYVFQLTSKSDLKFIIFQEMSNMLVYFYYLILYFFAVIFGMDIINFADSFVTRFIDTDSVEIFICMLIVSSILSAIFSFVLHFIYTWRYNSNKFLKRFYQVHFFATYISGAFSIVNIGGKTLEEWGIKGTSVDGNVKVLFLMLFFIAISNNAFYKTFEKGIVDKLEFTVNIMKLKIKRIK
ncbi:hypothetical protein FORC13_p090 (plasmid) [Bacillus cereus]|uniref:hypothetical protein n=1 Tax=Bacillus cereus TaxID=1396 RepID=UPI000744AF18|nr:hypothetical protein [Bacillus cereus]ALZ64575.1 hypothetical protein FORC13_p090 [Bacillus cereus]